MKKLIPPVLVLALSIGSTAWGIDSVKKTVGPTVSGTLQGITATEVTILKQGAGAPDVIPVSEVDTVFFGSDEPSTLRLVRNSAANGEYVNALTQLARIEPGLVTKPEIKAEVDFYEALCKAKQALGGGGNIKEAGTTMFNFVKNNPNSYHFYQATELMGDLLVADGDFDNAKKQYDVLANSPFPEFKARAAIAIGRGLLSQGKFAEAQTAFDGALTQLEGKTGPTVESQKFAALLGKAAGMAEQDQADQGIALVEKSIQGLSPEDSEILAQAYVTLGKCYEKKGAKKEALRAYLHVDLLYSNQPQSHVEALKRLASLWTELGKPERAIQVAETLKERYATSVGSP